MNYLKKLKLPPKLLNIIYVILSIILFLILIYILFGNLGHVAIVNWDEARHGVNAYEMIKNKDYIITTYNYKTDYWNLKPPISEYFIILGYKLFGYNAMGLRFYSALAMLLCTGICYFFCLKKIGKLASLWTVFAFSISNLLLFNHGARSGDADSLFVLLSTIALIALLINKENMRGFYVACLCFSIAFLVKSWHAGTIALIIICYFFINIKTLKLNWKKIVIALLCAIIPILIWGIARIVNDGPKFFEEMVRYDLLKRTSKALEGNVGDTLFYLNLFFDFREDITFIVLISIAIVLNKEGIKLRSDFCILLLSIFIPFIIFTIAKTKLYWYTFCCFPPIIILSSYGISKII